MNPPRPEPVDKSCGLDIHGGLRVRADGTYSAEHATINAQRDTKRYLELVDRRRKIAKAFLKNYDAGTRGIGR